MYNNFLFCFGNQNIQKILVSWDALVEGRNVQIKMLIQLTSSRGGEKVKHNRERL